MFHFAKFSTTVPLALRNQNLVVSEFTPLAFSFRKFVSFETKATPQNEKARLRQQDLTSD